MLKPCHCSNLPSSVKALPAVWAFKRKCLPDWLIAKWKARLNVHGDRQQHGVHFWETYAPVMNWSTVRQVLTLSLLNGFKTRQVDFIQAFTQAPLDCLIYMKVPAGFSIIDGNLQFTGEANKSITHDYVLQLKKNIYGLKHAGHKWYKCLYDKLTSAGFHQSKVDKCLFIRHDCIIVVYVGAYLGLDIKRNSEGLLEITQPGLINKVITICGLR
jgi:hypothetical protein